jgi:hypothetical protein
LKQPPGMTLFKDKKNIVILLLIILFLIRIPLAGTRFAFWVITGVILCFASDFLMNRIFLNKSVFPNSAIISGFIVSGILDYRQPWFILVIFSLLPVVSKHFLRFNQKHIFNPANFSLFIATLFKIPLTWGIESNTFLIIIFGIYFAYSYKKFPQVFGFLALFVGIFSIFKMDPIGLISWFFLFIMLIEPKTSGYGKLKGFVFGGIAGVACFLMFRFSPGQDPFVSCLFIANLARPALEKII